MNPARFRLTSVAVVNLRGFKETSLELGDGPTLLVGPNNSGKTSILRLLDWFLNEANVSTLAGRVHLTKAEMAALLPARPTRNQARRLTLGIEISDGRTRRRFPCTGNIVDLRMTAWASGEVRLNVGPPRRGEATNERNRQLAVELFHEVRDATAFTLIPASRDAASDSFREALRAAAIAKLEKRALHTRTGRAPAESTAIKQALAEISRVSAELVTPLWEEMTDAIPAGLAQSAELGPEVSDRALVSWVADNTVIRLVTGTHDELGVDAVEVGSGLQSLLELAINRAGGSAGDLEWILAIEEPEAFLHPSAQRTLARLLRSTPGRLIVSTHSAVVVDEARYGEVVLARDHHFYEPRTTEAADREQINTALLTGHGAEMAFASSLLLVEGEGDRLFFERLRRRIAVDSGDSRLDELYVLPVGGRTGFAPWLRLLRSYGEAGNRPINWYIVADDDAAQKIREAYSDAGITVRLRALNAIRRQRQALAAAADPADIREATLDLNRQTRARLRFSLLPGELETSMLSNTSDQTRENLAQAMGPGAPTGKEELITWLSNNKAAWRRALIADRIPWDELDDVVADVLTFWLRGAMSADAARNIMRGLG